MNKQGSIIIVGDIKEGQHIFRSCFQKSGYTNKLYFFADGIDALNFLEDSGVIPFLILADIKDAKS